MAGSYHQLGRVAELRGDYDAALDWYRKSLAIAEQLGDRAGMASTISQIGVLYTAIGRVAEAVPLNLQSLATRLQLQSPQVRINLHWLSHQRHALGADAFRAIVADHLDAGSMTGLFELLDDFDRQQGEKEEPAPATTAAPPPAPRRGLFARLRSRLGLSGP
jgi:hypothetical protein